MQLRYTDMVIDNFKSIRKLRIQFSDYAPGLYLVQGNNTIEPDLGSNGSGKSSLWDALSWIQFGKDASGLSTADLRPWSNGLQPHGTLGVQIGEQKYVIDRDGSQLRLNERDTTQAAIEQLLRLNHLTFCHSILLPQDEPLFFDLARTAKLSLLSNALQLDRWDERALAAKQRSHDIEHKINEQTGEIKAKDQQLDDLYRMSKDITRESKLWDEEFTERQRTAKAEIDKIKTEVARLQPSYDRADLAYDGAMTELHAARQSIHQLNDYIRLNIEESSDLKRGIATVESEVGRLRTELSDLNKKICPTCGQKLHKPPRRSELQQKIAELLERCDPSTLQANMSAAKDLEAQLKMQRDTEAKFLTKANDAQSEMNRLGPKLNEMDGKAQALIGRLEQDAQQGNPFREQRQQIRRNIERTQNEYDQLQEELRANKKRHKRVSFWSSGFKDVKLDIIKDVLQQLSICCDLMMPQLGLHDWKLELAIERETKSGSINRGIDVTVLSPSNGKQVKFKAWSGGEAQRLRLLGGVALSEVLLAQAGIEPTIQIFDEPTKGLSPGGVEDLVEFLAERAVRLGQVIFLVEQNALPSSRFAGTIAVRRGVEQTVIE
jgi:DNA repair exonuclease SbcCD ATPase subunit